MRKIIFVVHSLEGGGAEKVASILAEYLQKSEEDIKIILVLSVNDSKRSLGKGIDVRYLNLPGHGRNEHPIAKFFRVIIRLSRILKEESPCTLLSFMDYSNVVSIIGNWLSGRKNRVVISVHTVRTAHIREYKANVRERLMDVLIRTLYNRADSIIAVSRGVSNDLIKQFNIREGLMNIIHNPVDLPIIHSLSEEVVKEECFDADIPVILSVGRLSKEKGFDYLLRAFAHLSEIADVRLAVLGEGEEESRLKELSRNLGIDSNVFFLGFKNNPYKYMKRAAIFVLPSLYEGFGVVIVEAMACGVPVIATRSYDGIDNIINHEKNGLLVPVADEKTLSTAILRLLGSFEEREKYARKAKEKALEFSADKIANQYKEILLNTH
jgi:glycosyltransferase involved in cell wall biosynthesis